MEMYMYSKVYGWSEPLKKAIGAAIWQSGRQKFSNFSACKAQVNQHKIRIAFFEWDELIMRHFPILYNIGIIKNWEE